MFSYQKVSFHIVGQQDNKPVHRPFVLTMPLDGERRPFKVFLDKVLGKLWGKEEGGTCTSGIWRDDQSLGKLAAEQISQNIEDFDLVCRNLGYNLAKFTPGNLPIGALIVAVVDVEGQDSSYLVVIKVQVATDHRVTIQDIENAIFEGHEIENTLTTKISKAAIIPHPDPSSTGHVKLFDETGQEKQAIYFSEKFLEAVPNDSESAKTTKLFKALNEYADVTNSPFSLNDVVKVVNRLSEIPDTVGTEEVIDTVRELIYPELNESIFKEKLVSGLKGVFSLDTSCLSEYVGKNITIEFTDVILGGIKISGPKASIERLIGELGDSPTRLVLDKDATPPKITTSKRAR